MANVGRSAKTLAAAALLGQSVFFGYNWVVMKIALRYSDPWPFAALRTGLGAIVLFLLLILLRRPIRPRQPLLTMLLGLLQTTGMGGLMMWSLQTGAAGRASALVYSMPFWTMILAWIFLKDRIVGVQWLAVLFSLAGLVLVLDPMQLGGTLQSKLLALGAGVSWAGSTIIAKLISDRGPVDALNLTAWQMLYGCLPVILIAFLVPSRPIEWSGGFIITLVYNVIPVTALANFFWLYVLQVLPAGVASIGTLAAPVIAITATAIQLQERVSPLEGVGMAAIIAALLVLTLKVLFGGRARRRLGSAAVTAEPPPSSTATADVVPGHHREEGSSD